MDKELVNLVLNGKLRNVRVGPVKARFNEWRKEVNLTLQLSLIDDGLSTGSRCVVHHEPAEPDDEDVWLADEKGLPVDSLHFADAIWVENKPNTPSSGRLCFLRDANEKTVCFGVGKDWEAAINSCASHARRKRKKGIR